MSEVEELEGMGCEDIKYLGNGIYVGFDPYFAWFINSAEKGKMRKYGITLKEAKKLGLKSGPSNLVGGKWGMH